MQRAWSILVCGALAACGGGGGGASGDAGGPSDDGGGGVDAPLIDGPPSGTPLAERLAVATITTPAGVKAGVGNWRIWGTEGLRIAPVFTVPYADCGTLVGYSTGTAQAPHAHVARLDGNDALIATYDLGAYELRGLAAEPDGHFGALLWDDASDSLRLTRFDASGAGPRTSDLTDALAAPTDFGIGEARLEYGGGKYGAYYHVHGISGFAQGHEGDQLKWVDATSGAVTNGWSWGCSHSMSDLLRYRATGDRFLAACVTDCFPGTSGGPFGSTSIGGIFLDHDRSKVMNVNAGCNGSVAGELGGLTPAADTGFKLVFNTHQNAATPGQASYSTSTMNQDIGLASIGADGLFVAGSVTWLTTTGGNEGNASIARWSPAGEPGEQYVVGWTEMSQPRSYKLARVSAAGAILEGPVDVTATAKWGERDDPFREHVNQDVVWAWFDAPGATSFKLARLRASQPATCAAL